MRPKRPKQRGIHFVVQNLARKEGCPFRQFLRCCELLALSSVPAESLSVGLPAGNHMSAAWDAILILAIIG
jgi:hypothetical protein